MTVLFGLNAVLCSVYLCIAMRHQSGGRLNRVLLFGTTTGIVDSASPVNLTSAYSIEGPPGSKSGESHPPESVRTKRRYERNIPLANSMILTIVCYRTRATWVVAIVMFRTCTRSMVTVRTYLRWCASRSSTGVCSSSRPLVWYDGQDRSRAVRVQRSEHQVG
jgi:hypothetical protein